MTSRTLFRDTSLALGALLALCSLANAQQQTAAAPAAAVVLAPAAAPAVLTEAVKLRFVKPTGLVRQLMRPIPVEKGAGGSGRSFVEGLALCVPNDVAGTVTLGGSAARIQEYKAIIGLLDVAPRTLRLQIRLLRYEFAGIVSVGSDGVAHGNIDEEPKLTELARTEADAVNNTPVELSLVAGTTMLYGLVEPHVNGDGSVSLATKMRLLDEPEEIDWKSVPGDYRRSDSGKKQLFLDRGRDGAARPLNSLPYVRLAGVKTGYYLEITPLVNPAAPEKP